MDIRKAFQEHVDEEHGKFDRVADKCSERGDLHGFLLLDALLTGKQDIVACAEHDEIWLNIDLDDLQKVSTEEDIKTLLRCGITYDEGTDSLHMFV